MIGISVQIIIAGLALVGPVFGASHPEIHLQMTPEERLKIFQTAGTDVPPYEVVEIKSSRIQKRDAQSGHHIHIRAFGEEINHYLTPLDDVLVTNRTRIQTIRSNAPHDNENITVADYPVPMKTISHFIYVSQARGITLSIREDYGSLEVSGIIWDRSWNVSPLPAKFRRLYNLNRTSRSVDEIEQEGKSYHIISKIPSTGGQNMMNPLFRIKRSYSNVQRTQNSNHRVAYPEILVIVGPAFLYRMNNDMTRVIIYVISFWNGVDMLYRDLNDPPIRLNIATIAVAQGLKDLSYVTPGDPDKTLDEMGRWLYRNRDDDKFPISSYDVAFTMLEPYDLDTYVNDKVKRYADGIANPQSVCKTRTNHEKVWKCGFVTDYGTFHNIQTAARELGRILGSRYDGEGNDCNSRDGALMALPGTSVYDSIYSHWFSECSERQFNEFLYKKSSSCVWNDPKVGGTKPFPRILPGRILYDDVQCNFKRGYIFEVINESMCRTLVCRNSLNDTFYDGRPAADGTICAENKICLHGFCVDARRVLKYHRIPITFEAVSTD